MCKRYKHEQAVEQLSKLHHQKVTTVLPLFLEECIKLRTLLIKMAATNCLLKSILQSQFASLTILISITIIVLASFSHFKYSVSGNWI